MNPHKLKGRHSKTYTEIGKEDPRRGIFGRENENGNNTISASSTQCFVFKYLLNANNNTSFLINNETSSFLRAFFFF